MKLFAWQPQERGYRSFFVVADNEAEAFEIVDREIARRIALPSEDDEHLYKYVVEGWGTDFYVLTVADHGKIIITITNTNE